MENIKKMYDELNKPNINRQKALQLLQKIEDEVTKLYLESVDVS